MCINSLHICGIYFSVFVYITLCRIRKSIFSANMRVDSLHICGIDLPITIHIPDEIHRHIRGNITVAYRDLLGEWRMALLLHFQGIRPGGDGGEGIGCAVAVYGGLICRFGKAGLNELHGDILAGIALAFPPS